MHLKQILYYIRYQLKNAEAARSVKEDASETKQKLTYLAESMKVCEEPELARYGYRVISFQRHNYVMLYRVDGDSVYIDGIFHQLQNYQKLNNYPPII